MEINTRLLVFLLFSFLFIVALIGFLTSLGSAILSTETKLEHSLPLLSALGMAIMSYWIYKDGKKIENLIIYIKSYKEENWREMRDIKNEATNSKDLKDYKHMIPMIVSRCRNKGLINPELTVETMIRDRTRSGKTREQAIEELYKDYW